jgi:hypothetical protein
MVTKAFVWVLVLKSSGLRQIDSRSGNFGGNTCYASLEFSLFMWPTAASDTGYMIADLSDTAIRGCPLAMDNQPPQRPLIGTDLVPCSPFWVNRHCSTAD